MRYNKQVLASIASQTTQNFEREGVIVMKEKQDGFFRRSEAYSIRWFRLRGNLLFYLKGSEPWYEPIGVIILGRHQIKLQACDQNGHWPFQIVWENGVCYRLATFQESERTLWVKSLEMAPYEVINSQIVELREKLNKMRPIIDVSRYRAQNGIILDMNEVPLCELALSCDNLLCDAYGRPPTPLIVVYLRLSKDLCVKYGSTEIVETCSNPCFSKTVLFRGCDAINGQTVVRIVVYDVRERVSEVAVPMGYTTLQLSTIQESQRLRVALKTRDNKTIGFITMNSWSLEASCTGNSPCHTNDLNYLDIAQKVQCHRRSQSLPPKLGLNLKFPAYGSMIKQNFVNSYQVTYKFHSGLGGDINIHEIMAEPKLCYRLPIQLLDIFIRREKELLGELLSIGDVCGNWQNKQLDLSSINVSLLKHYSHSKRCLQQAEHAYFKASCKKDDSSLEFAPVNLHLQRMWVHNDTLNKTGFHDIITVGAFTAHSHKSERTGGLIRLVQHVKDINSTKAAFHSASANRVQSEYDNVMTMRNLRDEIVADMDRVIVLLQANQYIEARHVTEVIKTKTKSMLILWEPGVIEESLAIIGWPKQDYNETSENSTLSTIFQLTEQLSMFDNGSDCDTFDASSSSSSKETTPTMETPSLSSSVPNMFHNQYKSKDAIKNILETHLHFDNNYFNSEERKNLNHSFRSFRSPVKSRFSDSNSFDSKRLRQGSLRHDFKNFSLEQVSSRFLMESLCGNDKRKAASRREVLPSIGAIDSGTRENNLAYLEGFYVNFESCLATVVEAVIKIIDSNTEPKEDDLDSLRAVTEDFKVKAESLMHWSRISHAALRLRCVSPAWARNNAALQMRRDTCFSQALTSATAGLLCWFNSVPHETVLKLLTSDLGPLCCFEGLLSLYSTEKAMWGDMVVAVEDLQTVQFKLNKVGHSMTAMPQVSGSPGSLVVTIPISDALYSKFIKKEHLNFTIIAVFFNIGINEKATLAEALGETTPQYQSNNDNLDRLNKYYHKYTKIFPADYVGANRTSSRIKPLEEVMENLKKAVHNKVPKNVDVLHLAALATRNMNGIRFTSCKSAKDRTGMAVTYEQCSILSTEYHLAEHEMKKALNIMRSEGCRRENTYKNVGVKKYAFTKKQVMALPERYRPPIGTYGYSQT